jgi:hypothetical protein
MNKEILFDQDYIEQHEDEIIDVQLSANSKKYEEWDAPLHRVSWRLKGNSMIQESVSHDLMDEEDSYWSTNFMDVSELVQIYHLVKYECDRDIIAKWSGHSCEQLDKLVERMQMKYKKENEELRKENEELKLMIKYQPGQQGQCLPADPHRLLKEL